MPNNDSLAYDIKRYVDETEKNIIELNKSRLRALEDVNQERILRLSAERKVMGLEEKLRAVEEEMELLKAKLKESLSSYEQETVETAEMSPSVETNGTPVLEEAYTPVKTITLRYRTSWSHAYIHFKIDSKGWTKSPGMRLDNQGKEKVFTVEGEHLEFVLNNGRDDWDKPKTTNIEAPQNYKITSPGMYSLHNGFIKKCK